MADEKQRPDGILDKDDALLQDLGYKHELVREFTNLSTISFAFSILGCVASIASTMNTPTLSGGPATTVWAWGLGSFGCIAIGTSVAELVSAYPTAGGIYTTTGYMVPARWRKSVSWVQAWITVVGQLATPASVNFALALFIYALATIGTNGAFVASTGQVIGLYVGLNMIMAVYNSLPSNILSRITALFIFLNLAVTLICIVAVPAGGSGQLLPSSQVWSGVTDYTGWNNKGLAFLLGILSVSWVATDYDAAAHMSEEVKNAAVTVPVAIFSAVVGTCFLGFWVNVAMMYGLGDISQQPGDTGLVFPQILWQTLGTSGALGIFSLVTVVQAFTGITCQITCIRTLYAVSRDGGLPDFGLCARVNPVTKTPIWAGLVTGVITSLFGLLYLASYTAINAIFSITAVALDVSYAIPTAFKIYAYLRPASGVVFKPGPFYLGKWGYLINAYAVAWTSLETVILCMPQLYPVTSTTMNYAGPIMIGVVLAAWIWYMLAAHKWYEGPGSHSKILHEEEEVIVEDSDGQTSSQDEKEKI